MKSSDTFYIFDRKEWKKLNNESNITLTKEELDALRSLNDRVSMNDVEEVYLPMLQILDSYIRHYDNRQKEKKKSWPETVLFMSLPVAIFILGFTRLMKAG